MPSVLRSMGGLYNRLFAARDKPLLMFDTLDEALDYINTNRDTLVAG
ncbi:MAG: hypothetical protein GYB68_20220 [Chloroflexi bacterium]|nr:hypothetical protein [Chloroflexota bacterium]